jgi:hypothetical protein
VLLRNREVLTRVCSCLRTKYRRAFENRVLRRIFWSKRVSIIGGWRKCHNEELHNLYASPYIIKMIKSRMMTWAGHKMVKSRMMTWAGHKWWSHGWWHGQGINDEVTDDDMGRACNTHGEKRNEYRLLVGKPEGKRPLGRPRHRWGG